MTNPFLLIAAAFLIAMPPLGAAADEIDQHIRNHMKRERLPGVSVALVHKGKVIKATGYGVANMELNVPATEQTVYQWASLTKQFTAAAIQLLAVDRKLRLDDPLHQYYTTPPPAWTNITIRHLLTHTSGIKSYTDLPGFGRNPRKDYNGEELVSLVKSLPLEFSPGDRYSYSNTGYYLLGYIIEKVSGLSYGEFLKRRIFEPLQMDTARFNEQLAIVPNRATGYTRVNNALQTAEFVSPTQPFAAGGLIGSVLDLVKWDRALDTDKLLPRSARKELWTKARLNSGEPIHYGLGWSMGEFRDRPYMRHAGDISGFSAHIVRFPQDQLTVIVLINANSSAEQLANDLASIMLKKT